MKIGLWEIRVSHKEIRHSFKDRLVSEYCRRFNLFICYLKITKYLKDDKRDINKPLYQVRTLEGICFESNSFSCALAYLKKSWKKGYHLYSLNRDWKTGKQTPKAKD